MLHQAKKIPLLVFVCIPQLLYYQISTTHLIWFCFYRKLSRRKRLLVIQGNLCGIDVLRYTIYLQFLLFDMSVSSLPILHYKNYIINRRKLNGCSRVKNVFYPPFSFIWSFLWNIRCSIKIANRSVHGLHFKYFQYNTFGYKRQPWTNTLSLLYFLLVLWLFLNNSRESLW